MIVLGLTGSIGMGKSTAAQALRRLGVAIHDADAEVHRLMREDREVIAAIEAAFPGVAQDGMIDRAKLGQRVFGDPVALQRLESVLHPRVRRSAARFLRRSMAQREPVVALDIPLLFETGGDGRHDAVVVVSAPEFVQKDRVLRRPGMTTERFNAVLNHQMHDARKRRLADFVVPTGLDRRTGLQALGRIVKLARGRPGLRAYRARKRSPHA